MNEETLGILRCPECGVGGFLEPVRVYTKAPSGEWEEALLRCRCCSRPFRVEQGIADLVRDGLREVEDERAFFERHGEPVLGDIHRRSAAHPECNTPSRGEDLRIIEEGRHWSRFMQRFWDVGDRAIFDLREKASHPPLYVAGVLERDDRDARRKWSYYPPAAGEFLFPPLDELAGRWGMDAGCGGGQFGLEAARRGVRMIGFDPGFGELVLARRHAREQGIRNIDYVRGEPANPPLAHRQFALLMAKDSLHHVPALKEVFPRLLEPLEDDGWVVVHEHVTTPRLKETLLAPVRKWAVWKSRRRYPTVEIPEELLRDSANEAAGAEAVREVLREHCIRTASREDLYLAGELEMLVYFALGKRRWPAAIVYTAGRVLEKILLLLGDRQHVSFRGRVRRT